MDTLKTLVRRQPFTNAQAHIHQSHLVRRLSAVSLILLGIGNVIGAGIFVLTGHAAARYAGPGLVISFILAAIVCGIAGLCYAELAAMIPVAGGAYSYTFIALGEVPAWIVGMFLILENTLGTAAVAIGWSQTLQGLLQEAGMWMPLGLARSPWKLNIAGSGVVETGGGMDFWAVFIILVLGAIVTIGVQESSIFNNIAVTTKLVVLAIFIGYAMSYASSHSAEFNANLDPFVPANNGTFGEFGASGVFRGSGAIFFAFVGFDNLANLAQETINPSRNVPIGLLGTLIICTTLYIWTTVSLTGLAKYNTLDVDAPVAYALQQVGAPAGIQVLVGIGALAGLMTVCLVGVLTVPRVILTVSKDGLLPQWFSHVHDKLHTPARATVTACIFSALLAAFFPLDFVSELVSFGTISAFSMVCLSVISLRRSHPEFERPFRVPLSPVLPIIGFLGCAAQLISLPSSTWIGFTIWLALSMILYFAYGRSRSRVGEGRGLGAAGVEEAAEMGNAQETDPKKTMSSTNSVQDLSNERSVAYLYERSAADELAEKLSPTQHDGE